MISSDSVKILNALRSLFYSNINLSQLLSIENCQKRQGISVLTLVYLSTRVDTENCRIDMKFRNHKQSELDFLPKVMMFRYSGVCAQEALKDLAVVNR